MKNLKMFVLCSFFLGQLFVSQSAAAQGGTVKTSALEIAMVSTFTHVYSDRGTGSEADVSTWSPVLPLNFYALGYVAKKGYEQPTTSVIVVKAINSDAIAHPTGYKLIWNDAGSGGDQDGAVWEPIAPVGYVAMGTVTTASHNPPSLSAVVCIKASLTVQATVGNWIWNDKGSGANNDVSLWEMTSSSPLYITSGSFCGYGTHDQPSSSPVAFAIKLN